MEEFDHGITPPPIGQAYNKYDRGTHPWYADDPSVAQYEQSTAERLALGDRAYNEAQVDKILSWQERMSNTAYQRAIADMRRAGLNPYLAYSSGGASVPSGTSPNTSTLAQSYISDMNARATEKRANSDIVKVLMATALALIIHFI